MIHHEAIKREWIHKLAKNFGNADPLLVEKAAWVASLLKSDSTTIKKYGDPAEMKGWKIGESMSTKLNKLKKSNPEAFFYWYQIFKLTTS